jgi:hypothetical protein
MKTPDLKEVKLKSVKVKKNGGLEAELVWLYSSGNEAYMRKLKVDDEAPVHDDLLSILKQQKARILLIEEYNYRNMAKLLEKLEINNTAMIEQVAEGLNIEAMQKIEVTGFKLSGDEERLRVIVTYKKQSGNKKISGRATPLIELEAEIWGFEQDMLEDMAEVKKEVYLYAFKAKHSGTDQLVIWSDEPEEEENL